jgi:hypothetical protein
MGSSSLGGAHQISLLQPIVKISEGGLHGIEPIYGLKETKAWHKKGDETSLRVGVTIREADDNVRRSSPQSYVSHGPFTILVVSTFASSSTFKVVVLVLTVF